MGRSTFGPQGDTALIPEHLQLIMSTLRSLPVTDEKRSFNLDAELEKLGFAKGDRIYITEYLQRAGLIARMPNRGENGSWNWYVDDTRAMENIPFDVIVRWWEQSVRSHQLRQELARKNERIDVLEGAVASLREQAKLGRKPATPAASDSVQQFLSADSIDEVKQLLTAMDEHIALLTQQLAEAHERNNTLSDELEAYRHAASESGLQQLVADLKDRYTS